MKIASTQGQFDVPYGIPSARLTAGNTLITTTGADYFGLAVYVASAPVTMIVYNNVTASGVIIDVLTVTTSTRIMNTMPIRARVGLSVNLTGTNGVGTVFYTPKG